MDNQITNDELLRRLDLAVKGITTTTVAGESILNDAQFDRYVRMLQSKTVILPEARFMKMTAQIQDIDRVGFTGRVLKPAAAEGEALAEVNWAAPTFVQHKLTAIEVQGIVSLTDKLLRRNIERENFEDTLVDLFGERAGLDIEELGINGDTDSADAFLALTDGWLKHAGRIVVDDAFDDVTDSFTTAALETTQNIEHNIVPIKISTWTLNTAGPVLVAHDDGAGLIVEDGASGITGTIDYDSGLVTLAGLVAETEYTWDYDSDPFDKTANTFPENMFDLMFQVVPHAYFARRGEWRLYVPWWVENAYRDLLRARGTALGDAAQTGSQRLVYKAVPIVEVPSMPTTRSLLSHPDNMCYGVFHEVQLEREREAKAKRTDFILNSESDFDYENREAAVMGKIG